MNAAPARIDLDQWDIRHETLRREGLDEPSYGGPLRRHAEDGDTLLLRLQMDNSPAALRLWNFLLTEEERLHAARMAGRHIVGTMKDLGTVPVMAYALDELVAFYPDGAWWVPCIMEMSDGLLGVADRLGVGESFCPVRAMLAAFATETQFPRPDLLICSVGAICDDFSAIAQRVNGLGHPILWWEIPHRREPDPDEEGVTLPGGAVAPATQVHFVREELARVRGALENEAGRELDDDALRKGIATANRLRDLLDRLRTLVYTTDPAPLPALEMLIAEMLAIHFCSDREESIAVLEDLLAEATRRAEAGAGPLPPDGVRLFWVNPVADLRVMNLMEDCGARLCGSDYLFPHALDPIPECADPLKALAMAALADPMVGPSRDRAERIARDMERFGAEGLIISRIPGASHCAWEGEIIAEIVREKRGVPVLELEVPPLADGLAPSICGKIEAVIETILGQRRPSL